MKIILKYFTIILSIHFLYRTLFLIKYFDKIENPIHSYNNSIPVDLSTVSYITLLFIVLNLVFKITKLKTINSIIKYTSLVICIILFLAEYASIAIYEHWGSTITYRATSYLEDGPSGWKTLIQNIDFYIIPSAIILILHICLTYYILRKNRLNLSVFKLIITIPLLLLIMRGGIQKIPINSSKAFFSKNQTDNYVAVNKLRYFLDSYSNMQVYNELRRENANYRNIDSIMNINCIDYNITTDKPTDIILLVMEGIPNSTIKLKHKDSYIAKNLNRISKNSFRFTNAFSSGFRTDQGIISIFNGLPAYPYINILKKFSRLSKHDNLIDEMNKCDYKTSFIYGGESQFSNLKKYLLETKLDDLIDSDHFPNQTKTSSWGVPDHILLDSAFQYIKRSKTPTFTTILTSSSHIPFDIPNRKVELYNNYENFIASIKYLDNAINNFTNNVKTLTNREVLLIITSDHGSMHLGHGYNDHERFHIPLMVTGNALDSSYLQKENHRNLSLHDLPLSILSLVKSQSQGEKFALSTNIFSNCPNSNAYWVTDNALGYIENDQNLGLEHRNGDVFQHNLSHDSLSLQRLQQNAISTFNYYNNYLLSK